MDQIPLSRPDISQLEIDAVMAALSSERLSIGPRQDLFEQMVAERCGRRHGVAVNSGTSGLHAALLALDIGPGDEVITTPFSFVASANSILMTGATPVFVDICPRSLNMDPVAMKAAITAKTRGILAVEVFGNPTHMDTVEKIAQAHEIPLIEDACEGLGGLLKRRPIGGFGRASVFGFYPNKQITTGEGGMIVTDDDRLADRCRSLRNQGRATMSASMSVSGAATVSHPSSDARPSAVGSWLQHERLGYNYRLSEIACALGCAQMERLDEMLEKRRKVAAAYMRKLMGVGDIVLPNVPEGDEEVMSWFVFVVRLSDQYGAIERDRIIEGMRRHEIGASNYFPCIHLQPFYREQFGFAEGDFPIAERMSQRTIALPFYNDLDDTTIDLVCQTLKVMIQREQLSRDDETPS